MKGRGFFLKPFPAAACFLPQVKITGTVGRQGGLLCLEYELLGLTAAIAIPAPAVVPARRDGLWKETCFEFFLGLEESDRYWEFNFTPAGHWNVYSFETYRQGMREEQAFASLPFSVHIHPEALHLVVKLELERITVPDQSLKAGISAVVKSIQGDCTYWALTHPGPQADFHRRDSFIIEL
jgi:hypothetical protein